MAAAACDIEEFLTGPLVKWISTCVKKPESLQVYETFFDGSPVNEVLLQIDPEPSQPVPSISNLQGLSITAARTKIFHCIIKNIRAVYEDELGQIIIKVPDCVVLGRAPASQTALEQLKLLILLLLGCAVQGPTKELFISKIKELSVDDQHDIVECIKRVTEDQSIVLTQDWMDQEPQKLYFHIRTLTGERDKMVQQWVIDLGQETNPIQSLSDQGVESNHLAVELADWKARMRKQRQELEEKTEILAECREELEHVKSLLVKLRLENTELLTEARRVKAYRDEVDSMREKIERADRLEIEVQRYRERLADSEFYKVRVDELREDNKVLLETREMLETQLARARQRSDHVLELEAELLSAKQAINDVVLERDAAKDKIQELLDENIQLQQFQKSALQDSACLNASLDSDLEESNSGDNSLSEQLTSNAQARALKLELENKRLLTSIEALKENSFLESASKILELEKEKKKLSVRCEQLEENCERLTQQKAELENLFKNAIQETRKLQDSLDTQKVISDRQNQELNNERLRIGEMENNIDNVTKEKQRIQLLCDTIKKRADDAEKSLTEVTGQLLTLQAESEKWKEFERATSQMKEKVETLEKENMNMNKDIGKLKEALEVKDVIVDQHMEKIEKQEKDIERLTKDNEELIAQIDKFLELEKKAQELLSQVSVNTETISTLQKDLINEKVTSEKLKNNLDKLGLNADILDNDVSFVIEKMLNNNELLKIIGPMVKDILGETEIVRQTATEERDNQCEKLLAEISNLQISNDVLQNENAKLKVDISTLKSQINSLQTQQTALQLANSQLVAEKDELCKKQQIQSKQHDTLLLDQVTLRTIHEQLSLEYEEAKTEQENLKKIGRDLRSEMRTVKEKNSNLESKIIDLEAEKEILKNDAKSLANLRAEHSKLKDDFRNLFTASERLKQEYRAVQEELKNLRTESRNLRLGRTEMQGELNLRSDRMASQQLENAKLQQKCDMLFEMNQSLDSDRRALMDHVSQLLSQYHSLLTHSLEDKQHYHIEEKLYTDKVNNLCRQKEKLEEKIMEHYRKLDNASSKKKGFGATLVRRVRKAGSDIINKVPSRNRRSWHEDTAARLTQSQLTLLNDGSGESNGNNSDNSNEESTVQRSEPFKRSVSGGGSLHGHKPRDEVALRRSSYRDLASHRNSVAGDQVFVQDPNLSLGSVGTRRTVYLSEEDSTPVPPLSQNNRTSNTPPLLVYNRISTVIGEPQRVSTPQPQLSDDVNKETTNGEKEKIPKNAKETAIWYEYGCV
ncbi:girdin isoform X2 [Diorhabda sublineata]|uniref:girdin isoform X2 n=1 Tax=Diorhabda sublineata TaxID=1163346 RepID=UPI0024E17A12|nr:girdin isoform X2 [Diorhabda sublineata]